MVLVERNSHRPGEDSSRPENKRLTDKEMRPAFGSNAWHCGRVLAVSGSVTNGTRQNSDEPGQTTNLGDLFPAGDVARTST